MVLKSLAEGTGKNCFTDQLCNLIAQYSHNNISDFERDVVGNFNASLENCKLLVLNEMTNSQEQRNSNFDKMKSYITDSTLTINEKGEKARHSTNVLNFIVCTNQIQPVQISQRDRRYFVLEVSEEKVKNVQYFRPLFQSFKNEHFYPQLLNFFLS